MFVKNSQFYIIASHQDISLYKKYVASKFQYKSLSFLSEILKDRDFNFELVSDELFTVSPYDLSYNKTKIMLSDNDKLNSIAGITSIIGLESSWIAFKLSEQNVTYYINYTASILLDLCCCSEDVNNTVTNIISDRENKTIPNWLSFEEESSQIFIDQTSSLFERSFQYPFKIVSKFKSLKSETYVKYVTLFIKA